MSKVDITTAYDKARGLLEQHGLSDWSVRMNGRLKNSFGLCRRGQKRIDLNPQLVEANSEETVTNTILHEIAHALDTSGGPPHGPAWQAIALRIGASPKARYSYSNVVVPDHLRRKRRQPKPMLSQMPEAFDFRGYRGA